MKINCPSCAASYKTAEITQTRSTTRRVEHQCPNCSNWLRPAPRMMTVKTTGLIILLVFSLLNFIVSDIEIRLLFSATGFVGACIAAFGLFMGKYEEA